MISTQSEPGLAFDALPVSAPSPSRIEQFEKLREQTRRRAYSMALQLTRSVSEAEDLVQETYVKAWKGFDGYVEGRPFLNWLLRIMQRAHMDNRRRDNPIRKAESLTSTTGLDGESQEMQIADPQMSAEQGMVRDDMCRNVNEALNSLPEVYRTVLIMCDMEDCTYAEIADFQKTTIGTIRSRIHRARKMMREILTERSIR